MMNETTGFVYNRPKWIKNMQFFGPLFTLKYTNKKNEALDNSNKKGVTFALASWKFEKDRIESGAKLNIKKLCSCADIWFFYPVSF